MFRDLKNAIYFLIGFISIFYLFLTMDANASCPAPETSLEVIRIYTAMPDNTKIYCLEGCQIKRKSIKDPEKYTDIIVVQGASQIVTYSNHWQYTGEECTEIQKLTSVKVK